MEMFTFSNIKIINGTIFYTEINTENFLYREIQYEELYAACDNGNYFEEDGLNFYYGLASLGRI